MTIHPFRDRARLRSFIAFLAVCIHAVPASAQQAPEFQRWYEGLRDLAPDPTRGATVEGLTLVRDVGTFHFELGRIHLLEPIAGRTVGAVFVGQGRFEMTAPDPVEQAQLERAYGASEVSSAFRSAVLLFTDFTLGDLEAALAWEAREPDDDAAREIEEAREYFTDDDGWVDRKVMIPLINAAPGFFYAHFSEDRGDPMIFSVDRHYAEEVSLSKRRRDASGVRSSRSSTSRRITPPAEASPRKASTSYPYRDTTSRRPSQVVETSPVGPPRA